METVYDMPAMAPARYCLHTSGTIAASSTVVRLALDAVSKTELRVPQGQQPRLDQAWFWTPEWQAMEREAEDDLAAGHYKEFVTLDYLIDDLERPAG